MSSLIIVAIIVGLFFVFRTLNSDLGDHGIQTGFIWAGALLILWSYWFMPWLRLDPKNLVGSVIPNGEIVNSVLDFFDLDDAVADFASLTGWNFVDTVKHVSFIVPDSFLVKIQAPFYIAVVSLIIAGVTFILRDQTIKKLLGVIIAGAGAVSAVMLFLSLTRIRTFGADPSMSDVVMQFTGVKYGWGLWVVLAGLILIAVGGVVLALQSATTTQSKQHRSIRRTKSKTMRRSGKYR